MNSIVVSSLAVAAILALPTTEQFAPAPRAPKPLPVPPIAGTSGVSNAGVGSDLAEVRDRIHDGRKSGQLSRREARALRRDTTQVGVLADRYGENGLSDGEQRELDVRTRVLRDQVGIKRFESASRADERP